MKYKRLVIKNKIPKFIIKLLLKLYGFKIKYSGLCYSNYCKTIYTDDISRYTVINQINVFEDKTKNCMYISVVPYYTITDTQDWYDGKEAENRLKSLFPKILKYTELVDCKE